MWTASEDGFVKVGVLRSSKRVHSLHRSSWIRACHPGDKTEMAKEIHHHHRSGTFGRVGVSVNMSQGRLSTLLFCTPIRASSSQVLLAGLSISAHAEERA